MDIFQGSCNYLVLCLRQLQLPLLQSAQACFRKPSCDASPTLPEYHSLYTVSCHLKRYRQSARLSAIPVKSCGSLSALSISPCRSGNVHRPITVSHDGLIFRYSRITCSTSRKNVSPVHCLS